MPLNFRLEICYHIGPAEIYFTYTYICFLIWTASLIEYIHIVTAAHVLSRVFSLSRIVTPVALIISYCGSSSFDQKMLFTLLILVAVVSADPRVQFEAFKIQANKTYASLAEEEARFEVFQDNLNRIAKHNSEGHSWTMGVTKFADLTRLKITIAPSARVGRHLESSGKSLSETLPAEDCRLPLDQR